MPFKEGKVAGAALDVFEKEPAVGNPLFELEEVIRTPHLGASTGEAQENVSDCHCPAGGRFSSCRERLAMPSTFPWSARISFPS